ncbi:heterokaryon incompatibility protein-domain-containing protein [Amylocarpus encephaloides]|uniref:Heterokaryon incompatibility protein-domain-containing protein n=1 Tax=Amylocarpus encephaloides TaxID=45428 RepID=A0A9P7YDQ5_9HELO|nr:heterokaryon incompatibility protein-domain-containing protein [Amylocarpus encephaloides]
MICGTCYRMLRGHVGSQWRGTYDLHFKHQPNREALRESADKSCGICRSLYAEVSRLEQQGDTFALVRDEGSQPQYISACLAAMYGPGWRAKRYHDIYRLDFKMNGSAQLGTFILQPPDLAPPGITQITRSQSEPTKRTNYIRAGHTQFSHSTSSDEVLELAKRWLRECEEWHKESCTRDDQFYPKRLIELGIPPKRRMSKVTPDEHDEVDKVRLVLNPRYDNPKGDKVGSPETKAELKYRDTTFEEPKDKPEKGEASLVGNYVTHSHCWGKKNIVTLTEENIDKFIKEGIELKDLPKTFQEAIGFARRLSDPKTGAFVKYIWIDSLCIMQGDSDAARKDWLSQSASMYSIYKNSYCNISATASRDGSYGLYRNREPQTLWEEETIINISGIPGREESKGIQRCSILDLSFWEKSVDEAPVNTRGWVLQERLLSPRVIHFCENQIAWECHQKDCSESWPNGLPDFQAKGGDVIRGGRLKHLVFANEEELEEDDDEFGHALRKEPDMYGPWKRVVEKYSRTQLSNEGDKIIALSGVANMMADYLKQRYVAGLWGEGEGLVNQLLWRVDPIYEKGKFECRSWRPKWREEERTKYRAPSFSWAAVEAERGIAYGDTTKGELHVEVKGIQIENVAGDPFGLVKEGANIVLEGVLKKILLSRLEENGERFTWSFVGQDDSSDTTTFRNVYLDAPNDDADALDLDGQVYCLPVRTNSGNYLICLLLQLLRDGSGSFKRIGITKIPPYIEEGRITVLQTPILEDHADIPGVDWNPVVRKHTIRIV